ncbi:MAG: Pelagibacter phage [Bacteroidota bacterium]|jgi:hypothetical protein
MSELRNLIEKLTAIHENRPSVGDGVFLDFGNILEVESEILALSEDSMTILGDEKLFKVLESLEVTEANLWPARDFGGKNYIKHYRDDYFIATGSHEGDDVKKTDHYLLKKEVATDDEMTPAYKQIATLNVSPYKASQDDIRKAAETAIEKTESVNEARYEIHHIDQDGKTKAIQHHGDDYSDDTIRKDARYLQKNNPKSTIKVYKDKKPFDFAEVNEGEVVQFKRPQNRGDMQNLNAAKQIIRDMYWVGYMEETPDLPSLIEYRDELKKIGYDVNIKFNHKTQEDYAVLTHSMTNERYTMDENDLIGESLYEADYHGRKVPLGKPMRGDVKKFKVYVKDPKTGNVKKVNFGDKKMRIKKSNPKRRKSFRARHNCANPGPRTKARYWSCRKW